MPSVNYYVIINASAGSKRFNSVIVFGSPSLFSSLSIFLYISGLCPFSYMSLENDRNSSNILLLILGNICGIDHGHITEFCI